MKNYYNFLFENTINDLSTKVGVEIKVKITISKHCLESLNRNNNDPDRFGEKIIKKEDVFELVQRALILFFKNKIFKNYHNIWEKDKLIKNICIKNIYNDVNLVCDVTKIGELFNIVVVSAMRKKHFNFKNDDDVYTVNIEK